MEDSDNDYLTSLLALKNAEIERLNADILAHSARASNLHSRLLQAFDVLDESQRTHARELRDVEHKYARLDRRSQRQTVALNTCETEKDDLKESVLQLVEKVEQSNDIRSWPFNRLQLTRFTENPRQLEPIVRHSIDQEQLSYAGAIINRLRRERDEERVGHVLTCEALQSRIDTLEAQLARREAELEYCATDTTRLPLVLSGRKGANTGSSRPGGTIAPNPPGRTGSSPEGAVRDEPENGSSGTTPMHAMTNEEIIKMLNMTAARNRALEVEIKTLFKRLGEARWIPVPSVAASVSKPLPQLQQSGHIAISRPHSHLSHRSSSTRHGAGATDDRNGDARGCDQGDVDGDDDRVDDNQQRRSRNHARNRGPSHTQIRTSTPSGHVLCEDGSSKGHSPKAKHVKGPRVEADAHETDDEYNRNQGQGPGSAVRVYQSSPTPLSDSIDDDHSIHDDSDDGGVGVGAIWRSTLPAPDSLGTHYSSSDIRQGHVSPGLSTTGLDGASDVGSQELDFVGLDELRPKSAIMAGLDAQVEELSTQIDAFRQERENLLKMVAEQRRRRESEHGGWEDESSVSGSRIVARLGDDQSVGGNQVGDGTAEDVEDPEGDQDGDVHTGRVENEAFDALAHRLSFVEADCVRLRHELEECRGIRETRENELLAEIQVLERRVEELSMRCDGAWTRAPLGSDEKQVVRSGFRPGGEQQVEQRFLPEPEMEPLIVDTTTTTNDDELHTSHLRFRERRGSVTEGYPLFEAQLEEGEIDGVRSGVDLGRGGNGGMRLLRLDEMELDGLLDAIDGEASMELATPLVPTMSLLGVDDSSDGDRDQSGEEEDMVLEGMSELRDGRSVFGGEGGEGEEDGVERALTVREGMVGGEDLFS